MVTYKLKYILDAQKCYICQYIGAVVQLNEHSTWFHVTVFASCFEAYNGCKL